MDLMDVDCIVKLPVLHTHLHPLEVITWAIVLSDRG